MNITRSHPLIFLFAFSIAAAFGCKDVGPKPDPQEKGGYFCCNSAGSCVYTQTGECPEGEDAVWCPEIREVNGQVTCADWG